MSQTAPAGDSPARRYFSWAEAESYTGLSELTLRRMVARGQLRLYRPTPRRALLDKMELDSVISASVVAV